MENSTPLKCGGFTNILNLPFLGESPATILWPSRVQDRVPRRSPSDTDYV